MKITRLQPVIGLLLLTWTGIGMAQNASAALRQHYNELRESMPLTQEQQQMFENKIKALELQQAWAANHNQNTAGAPNALQSQDAAETEEDVEYYIEE